MLPLLLDDTGADAGAGVGAGAGTGAGAGAGARPSANRYPEGLKLARSFARSIIELLTTLLLLSAVSQ